MSFEKLEATFDFVAKNVSKMDDIAVRSPARTICNLSWNISLRKNSEKADNPSLEFFMECNGGSKCHFWGCIATIKLIIVSQKKDVKNSKGSYRTLFSSDGSLGWGFSEFMSWADVVNPECGFVEDDKIISRARLIIDNTRQSASWGIIGEEYEQHPITVIESNIIDDAKSEATFDLILSNISKLKDSAISLPCMIHSLPWKIKVIRKYENPSNLSSKEIFGFYLLCDNKSKSPSWRCFADVKLMVLSLKEGVDDLVKKYQQSFCSDEKERGYREFLTWSDVIDPSKGFIKEDKIVLRAHVSADVPTNAEYIGLMKQQGTFFFTSILQTLYFVRRLRKAIYKLPVESDPDGSIENFVSVLQRIFYKLQTSDKPVSVENFTTFFRYERFDLFAPYDVQKFLEMLFDKLEDEMKNTSVEGTIRDLFEGKIEHFVKCTNIEYECSRTESFHSITLDIQKDNIHDALWDYFHTEVLKDNRKYDAGDYGLQNAKKEIFFQSLPSVLLIHLKRFDYNHLTGCCKKSHKEFKFDEKLFLGWHVKNVEFTNADYTLFAVLAHSGSFHGGRYMVFISPNDDGIWYEFHDGIVSICPKKEAIENNFGNYSENSKSAHMLVYIRDSMFEHVLPVDNIPSNLKIRLEEELKTKQAKREEHEKLYTTIRVLLEDCFDGHQGPDLFDMAQIPDFLDKEETLIRVFEVEKTATVGDVLIMLSKSFGYLLEHIRIWPFVDRPNKSYRPTYFDVDATREEKIGDIVTNNYWNIFLELLPIDLGNYPLPLFDNESRVLLFFKLYEPKIRKIYYCEHSYFDIDSTFEQLVLKLNEKAGYPPDTKLIMYKELKARTLREIVPSSGTLEEILEELSNGDIIVFQKDDPITYLPGVEDHYN